MLESIFVAQQATLITHGHFDRKEMDKPRFHIWPLLRTYKTAEEAITRWKANCPTMNGKSCCTPGHHFTRITQYPLNTPESYYQKWGTDSYMAQYNYLQDAHGATREGPSANKSIYFGDDGKELINPRSRNAYLAQQDNYFGTTNGRGSDIGWHFRDWWLRDHGFIKKDAPPVTAKDPYLDPRPGEMISPLYFHQRDAQLIWPEGDNPNGW